MGALLYSETFSSMHFKDVLDINRKFSSDGGLIYLGGHSYMVDVLVEESRYSME